METFFTSDTHFGHENIIKYCKRPFANAEEMNETMIERWNKVVKPADLVYHLGDFAFKMELLDAVKIGRRLNGKIRLIEGNHDQIAQEMAVRFDSIHQYDRVKVNGQWLILFHYGMRTWWHDLRGVWHLYGHSHGGLEPYGKSADIGVDVWNFTPVHFDQVREFMNNREVGKHPMFADFMAEQIA